MHQVGRVIGQVLSRLVVVARQVLPRLSVQNKQGAAVSVQAQLTVDVYKRQALP